MEKQLQHSLIKASKSDWDRYEQQKGLVQAPWHGTQTGVFFGWHERVTGVDSSRDKERSTLGEARVR
jgi:hypothetical protein